MGFQDIEHNTKECNREKLENAIYDEDHGEHALEVLIERNISSRRRRRLSILHSGKSDGLNKSSCFLHQSLGASQLLGGEGDGEHEMSLSTEKTHKPRYPSKRDLDDMTLGIRKLSMQLNNMKFRPKIRRILIVTKAHDDEVIDKTRYLVKWLLSTTLGIKYTIFVEETLEKNKRFDVDGILGGNCDGRGQLRFWTRELCSQHPYMFDFVITVRYRCVSMLILAWWRWYCALYQLALSTRSSPRTLFCAWLSWISYVGFE